MPVPMGNPIRWSEMENSDELFLAMATPTPEDIEIAMAETIPILRALLEAELVEDEDIVGA